MDIKTTLLIAFLATGALSAPLSSNSDLCAKRCIRSEMRGPLTYSPSKTYEYKYVSNSKLDYEQQNKPGQMQLSCTVSLAWINECNALVTIKNPTTSGDSTIIKDLLTQKPLLVGIQGGLITDVCADPDDEPDSLNLKKGIISHIQISLPTLSGIYDKKTFEERDIIGSCPTTYEVQEQSGEYIVEKTKNHMKCRQKRFQSRFPSFWNPIPTAWEESNSKCVSKVSQGIVKSSQCSDNNKFSTQLTNKFSPVNARQESKLELVNVVNGVPSVSGKQWRRTTIDLEEMEQSKKSKFAPFVVNILSEICEDLDQLESKTPRLLSKMVSFLYRTPANDIKNIRRDIQNGQICSKRKAAIEGLFHSALLSVKSSSAVSVVLDDIKNQKLSAVQTFLYAIRLQNIQNPSLQMVEQVSSVFDDPEMPASIYLAAGSVIRNCRSCCWNQDKKDMNNEARESCSQNEVITKVWNKLSQQIISSCSTSAKDDKHRLLALKALKTAGNMRNMPISTQKVVMTCLQSVEADISVRTSAAESLRQSSIQPKTSHKLLAMVKEPTLHTEVRIACYLAVVDKVSVYDLWQLVSAIQRDPECQVRSFIFSHMQNLQKNENPQLQELRYKMLPLIIPEVSDQDRRSTSLNSRMSWFSRMLGLGFDADTNTVFSPESRFLRSLQLNATSYIFGQVRNLIQAGIRVEGLDDIVTMVTDELDLPKEAIMNCMTKMYKLIKEHGTEVMYSEKWENEIKALYRHMVQHINSRQGAGSQIKLDSFIRLFGEELGFLSVSGSPSRFINSHSLKELIERLRLKLADLVAQICQGAQYDSASFYQLGGQALIPTVQGIPLQNKGIGSIVASVQLGSKLQSGVLTAKTNHQVAIHLNSFIGYTIGNKVGLRVNATRVLAFKPELQVDVGSSPYLIKFNVPEKTRVLYSSTEAYVFEKQPGKTDTPKNCLPVQQLQQENSCSPIVEKSFGLKWCLTKASNDGLCKNTQNAHHIVMEKKKPNQPVVELRVVAHKQPNNKELKVSVRMPCSNFPDWGSILLSYSKSSSIRAVVLQTQGSVLPQKTIKASVNTVEGASGREHHAILYVSNSQRVNPQTDKMMNVLVSSAVSQDSVSGHFVVQTHNEFRKKVEANVNVEARLEWSDLNRPWLPPILDLRQCQIDLAAYGYSTKTSIQQQPSNLKIKSENKTPSGKRLEIDASSTVKGSFNDETAKCQLVGSVKTSQKSWDLDCQLHYMRSEKKVMINLQNQNKQKVLDSEITLRNQGSHGYEASGRLELPEVIKPLSLSGQVKEVQSHVKIVNLKLKSSNEPILSVHGPVVIKSQDNYISLQRSNLTVEMPKSQQYVRFESNYVMQPWEMEAGLKIVRTHEELVTNIQASQKLRNDRMSRSLQLNLPKQLDSLVKYESVGNSGQERESQLSVDLRLPRQNNRRVKGQWSISYEKQTSKGSLALDADRNQEKQVEYSLSYHWDSPLKRILTRGQLTLWRRKYQFDAESSLGFLSRDMQNPTKMEVKIINNQQRQFQMMGEIKKQMESGFEVLNITALCINYSNQKYRMVTVLKNQIPQDKDLQRFSYKLVLENPDYRVDVRRDCSVPSQGQSEHVYSQTSLNVQKRGSDVCNLQIDRKGSDVNVNLLASSNSYHLKLHSSENRPLYFKIDQNNAKILDAKWDVSQDGNWEITLSSKQNPRTYLPPSFMPEEGMILSKGSIQLDIFKQEPVVIQVALSKNPDKKSLLVNAVLNQPHQHNRPVLRVKLSMVPRFDSLAITIKDDIRSQSPIAKLFLQHRHINPNHCNIHGSLITDQDKIELAALITAKDSLSCMGASVNGTIKSVRDGKSLDLASSVCGPAYVEFGARPSNAYQKPWKMVKLGLKSWKSLKFAAEYIYDTLDKKSNCQGSENCESTWNQYQNAVTNKKVAFMAGAKVTGSQFVNVATKYDADRYESFMQNIRFYHPIWNRMVSNWRQITSKINLSQLQVSTELQQFSEKVKHDVKQTLEHPTIKSMLHQLKDSSRNVQQCWQWISTQTNKMGQKLSNVVEKLTQKTSSELVDDLAQWYRNLVHKCKQELKRFEEWVIEKITSSTGKPLPCPLWHYIKQWLINHREKIIDNLNNFNDNYVPSYLQCLSEPIVQDISYWLMNLRNRLVGPLVAPILRREVGVSITSGRKYWASISVPVQRPVASLPAALVEMGLPRRSSRAYLRMEQNENIASLNSKQAVTISRIGLNVVPSKCPIVLLKDDHVRITGQFKGETVEIVMECHGQKLKAKIGQGLKLTSSTRRIENQEIKIDRISEQEMVIQAGRFTVWLTSDAAVFSSPSSKPHGLLGDNAKDLLPTELLQKQAPKPYLVVPQSVSAQVMQRHTADPGCEVKPAKFRFPVSYE